MSLGRGWQPRFLFAGQPRWKIGPGSAESSSVGAIGSPPKQVHLESCGDKKHQETHGLHRRRSSNPACINDDIQKDVSGDQPSHVPIDIRCDYLSIYLSINLSVFLSFYLSIFLSF